MKGPLIGITPFRDGRDYRLYPEYAQRVAEAGGAPVILPLTEDDAAAERYAEACDGFLFTGGDDVSPALYGEEPLEGKTFSDPVRDGAEASLLKAVLAADKPVFGICRGLQFVNVFLGGTLYQDLPAQRPSPVVHAQPRPFDAPSHRVAVFRDTPLSDACGTETIAVNSLHHQGIKDLSPRLSLAAEAEDGLAEAAFMPDKKFVLLVQWHPELTPADPFARSLFRTFVRRCR